MFKIQGSVGRGGRNQSMDVRVIQQALNQKIKPLPPLKVDGIVGPKTQAAIDEFERREMKMARPGGRIEPTGVALSILSGVSAVAAPAAPGGMEDVRREIATMRAKEASAERRRNLDELEDALKKDVSTFSKILKILEKSVGTGRKAARMVDLWIGMKEWGCTANDIAVGLRVIATEGEKAQPIVVRVVDVFADPRSGLLKFKGALGTGAKLVSRLKLVLTILIAWDRADYGVIPAEVYKLTIKEGVPIGKAIDDIQDLIKFFWPGADTNSVFKFVRVVNPVALGGIAVDSAATIVQAFIEGKGSEQRLGRLVGRMRESGAGALVEIGDNLGDAMYTISQMSDQDFHEMISAKNIVGWIKSLVP